VALYYHPNPGTVVICDFRTGFVVPEMTKRRLAVVITPRFRRRNGLCTIVSFSTTPPLMIQPYHYRLVLDPPMPAPYNSTVQWVKADMLATVSFSRLFMPFDGKDKNGKRKYVIKILDDSDLKNIRKCVLHALHMSHLTAHL